MINMAKNKSTIIINSQQGSVLLEALISVLIFSMGILALAGLQGVMVKNASDAKYRADASFVAQQRLGAIWSDPDNLASFVETETAIANTILPNGKRTVAIGANRYATVTVTWQAPGMDIHNYTASSFINVSN